MMTTISDTDILRAERVKAVLETMPQDRPLDLRRADTGDIRPGRSKRAGSRRRAQAVCENDDDLFDNVPV